MDAERLTNVEEFSEDLQVILAMLRYRNSRAEGEGNMNAVEALDELQRKARHDDKLREQFIKTRDAEDPLGAFCSVCREAGYELYPMDIVQAGDEFYAAMKRSTNGGGENSPVLIGEDDPYELFFAGLQEQLQ